MGKALHFGAEPVSGGPVGFDHSRQAIWRPEPAGDGPEHGYKIPRWPAQARISCSSIWSSRAIST
ncbi:MAG: hypothetical protein WA709_18420, partial [Stellaceae bacterium]